MITQVIKILVVLVVGQTDGVGAHLPNNGYVLLVHRRSQGVARARPVLVPGYAPQGIGPAVEEEAFLGVNAEGAAAERC